MGFLVYISNINFVKIFGFYIYDEVISFGSCFMLVLIVFGYCYDSVDLYFI